MKQKYKSMRSLLTALIWISFTLSLAGCATTTIETSRPRLQQPLCVEGTLSPPVAIYWRPQWRPDQKEPPVREALAQKGIERFIARHACLNVRELKRLPSGQETFLDQALVQQAGRAGAEQVVVIVVRELGPKLTIGIPVILKGGTEVVIEVRILNAASAAPLADMRTHWEKGGAFVVKGLWTLEEDMDAALEASLM
ncbi:MAG: hypothetical protein KKA63_02060 [Gammaproteobacteria bacterium]|nr:hypothetical protein [Gammaproteobacteria bacterium]